MKRKAGDLMAKVPATSVTFDKMEKAMKLFESIVREGPLKVLPAPQVVRVPMSCHRPEVQCGQDVARGVHIGGGRYAPISGTITEVHPYYICITAGKEVQPVPKDLSGLRGDALRQVLGELGAKLPQGPTDTLIINGVDPEPGVTAFTHMLTEFGSVLSLGLETARKIYNPAKCVLAVEQGRPNSLNGCDPVHIKEGYPNGLNPLVVAAVTGKEAPEDTVVLSVGTLFELGRIMETGLPCVDVVLTANERNFVVTVGTPADTVLSEAGLSVRDGDTLVLGGHMRGEAAHSPQQGVDKNTYGLFVIRKGEYPAVTDAPCIGCGECIQVCPARIDPSTISGYAEFRMYEKCADHDIDACMECGMCGFFCISRRPLLQYIRLAKQHLAFAAQCELEPQREG